MDHILIAWLGFVHKTWSGEMMIDAIALLLWLGFHPNGRPQSTELEVQLIERGKREI